MPQPVSFKATAEDRATIRCGTSIITGLVVYDRQWTDTTTPRTDRPVRFVWGNVRYRKMMGFRISRIVA